MTWQFLTFSKPPQKNYRWRIRSELLDDKYDDLDDEVVNFSLAKVSADANEREFDSEIFSNLIVEKVN